MSTHDHNPVIRGRKRSVAALCPYIPESPAKHQQPATPCWDVTYINFLIYITSYITKVWLYSTFVAYIKGSGPLLGSTIPSFWLYRQ